MKKTNKLIAALLAFLLIVPMLFLPVYAAGETPTDNTVNENGGDDVDDTISVVASDKFTVVVDYYAERLLIVPYEQQDYIEIGTKEDSELYKGKTVSLKLNNKNFMYAFKTTSNELLQSYNAKKRFAALANDKWYPIYGGDISIEKVIPKKAPANAKKAYYIAVRAADDNFAGDFGYMTRIAVPIKSRYFDKSLKKLLEYDADLQEYKISREVAFGGNKILFSFDNFGYNEMQSNSSIKVPSASYFNGGSLKVKTAPILSGGGVQYASSAVIKYTIPKAGASPAVKIDSKKAGLVSLKNGKMEYSKDYNAASENPGTWQTYTDSSTTVLYTDFASRLKIDIRDLAIENEKGDITTPDTVLPGGEYYYVIYFRTKAVSKKTPASPPKKIKIPYDEVMAALAAAG